MSAADVLARLGRVTDQPVRLRVDSPAGRWVLAATVLGSAVTAIDGTVVGIALPYIGRDFKMSVASLQWVVTAYLLALAGLLLVGGALGDRFGRRRVFVVGVSCFALTSTLCAAAPDAGVLIAGRALQGVSGALLVPGSLAILRSTFAPDEQGRAIGAWSGWGGVATAVGPFLGGFLIGSVSWRLIFLINLPVAAAVAAVAAGRVPETSDPATAGVDLPGAVLATGGLVGLSAGFIDAASQGWTSAGVVAALVAGAAVLGAFVLVELRTARPMLPLGIFRSTQFSATNAVTFLVYAALGGALFLLPIELEQVARYSALEAGASPSVTVFMLALSARSGALAARIGPKLQMSVGPVLVGAGMVLLRRVSPSGDYLTEVLPAMVVLGSGLAATVAPLTATALTSAPAAHAGLASAVNNDLARAGGLVAVSVLPVVAGLTGASYLHPGAFDAGFRTAVAVSGVAAACGGLLSVAFIRNPPRPGRPARSPSHCALEAAPLATAAVSAVSAATGPRPGATMGR